MPEVASEALSGADRKGHVCHFPVSLPSSALDAVRRDFSSIYFVPEAVLADRDENEASQALRSAALVQHGDSSINRVLGVGRGRRHEGRERGWEQVTTEPKRERGTERPGTASVCR